MKFYRVEVEQARSTLPGLTADASLSAVQAGSHAGCRRRLSLSPHSTRRGSVNLVSVTKRIGNRVRFGLLC